MTRTALVLAGHGSHISPETAGLIWEQVDSLRQLGVADEVTAAFWKEMPAFSTVLNSLTADDITIVPMFTAQGYFTQTVIPAEMKLTGRVTQRDGRVIRYARTLSEHPFLSTIVESRVRSALAALNASPEITAVAIIGHSTRRNPESRLATEAQADRIREKGMAREVVAVYLDDEPEIREVYSLTSAPNLIAVPFFLAMGSHTTIDVPYELGVTGKTPPEQVQGRMVYYTPSVGVEADWREVVIELAREVGAPLRPAQKGSTWDCFPSRGLAELWAWVEKAGVVKFGQLRLMRETVSHWDDENPTALIELPDVLRRTIREKLFHFLSTSHDLPRGWYVNIDGDAARLYAIVETIYPGAVADWSADQSGEFRVNTFQETIARQTGNYRQLAALDHDEQNAIVKQVCGGCVRHPTWFQGVSPENGIPCPEPCNHWLSAALADIEKVETV